jgi:predicted transcriptional regulator
MAKPKIKIAITIDADLLANIDRICNAEGRSRSSYIERAIKDSVGEGVAVVNALTNPVIADAFAKAFQNPEVMGAMLRSMGEEPTKQQTKMFTNAVDGVVENLKKTRKKKGR